MNKRALGLAATVFSLVAGLPLISTARADGGTSVGFGNETWYEPDPACQTPVGCLPVPLPAVNPYGAGTLHVAVSAGQETARAYLTLKALTIPADQTVTSAPFVVPLDTATLGNGSLNPSTAKVQVCPTTLPVTGGEGAFDLHPATDCSNSVTLTYTAGATSSLTGDLAPIINEDRDSLAAGTVSLALIPADPQPTDTWHVVFSSDSRTSPPTPPASLSLVLGAAAADDPSSAPSPTVSPLGVVPPAKTSSAPAAPAGSGTTKIPAVTTVLPASSVPPAAAPAPAGVTTVGRSAAAPAPTPAPVIAGATGVTRSTGATVGSAAAPVGGLRTASLTLDLNYQYPALLLLPIALVVLVGWVIRLMTRDVTPRS